MGVGGLGVRLADVTGETESFDGGLEEALEDGVVGRPVGLGAGEAAGDFRERNGEMLEDRWDLEMLVDDDILQNRDEGRRRERFKRK